MPHTPAPRLELSLPKIVAGALAAASAAVASSWLGVAGTVFGAVVVSVVATVGTALYAHSLERSQQAIQETIPVLAIRSRADHGPSDGPETLELSAATSVPERRPISWATVAVSCVATLALGLGVLTGFEGVIGRSASELTGSGSGGGTTLGDLVDRGGKTSPDNTPHRPSSSPSTLPSSTSSAPTTPATTGPTTPTPTSTSPTSPTTTGPTTTEPTTTEPTTTQPTTTGIPPT